MDEPGPIYLVQREVIEAVGECHDERIGPSADDDLFLRLVARYTLYYSGNPYHAHNPTRHWSIVDQAIEDLKTLRKVFKDDALPSELRCHEDARCTCFHRKTMNRAIELLAEDQIHTAQRIGDTLQALGYPI